MEDLDTIDKSPSRSMDGEEEFNQEGAYREDIDMIDYKSPSRSMDGEEELNEEGAHTGDTDMIDYKSPIPSTDGEEELNQEDVHMEDIDMIDYKSPSVSTDGEEQSNQERSEENKSTEQFEDNDDPLKNLKDKIGTAVEDWFQEMIDKIEDSVEESQDDGEGDEEYICIYEEDKFCPEMLPEFMAEICLGSCESYDDFASLLRQKWAAISEAEPREEEQLPPERSWPDHSLKFEEMSDGVLIEISPWSLPWPEFKSKLFRVDGEEAYQTFQRVIENANVIMATYEDPLLGDVMVYPEKGTVAFSAGLHGWAFTLTNFAKMYASNFGVDESKMMERLGGENFFDPATKKWTTKNTGSATCKRGFVQFCYEPIKQIINTYMNDQKDKLWPMLQKLGVTMKSDEKELMAKALMERVMQTWLPPSSAVLEMMIFHLPSPSTAQRYRVENFYEGPLDDQYANAIGNYDPEGPLMLYVSKMIPASDKGRFFAFGRVFAGESVDWCEGLMSIPERQHFTNIWLISLFSQEQHAGKAVANSTLATSLRVNGSD
ncbi:hypothetical protein Vadar_016768 [Vaccinium darrowii]|uniref:Uncharacterized protein n=1 Tax=Vaccinium darrowii TaxID=229202 RepID=A0ACB7YNC0_9ERIC|nr:hypothetical protein Vadar_016768 [Vaccinium darrowii]